MGRPLLSARLKFYSETNMSLPVCECHSSLSLTKRQTEALEELRGWVAEYGAEKLSSALIKGEERGNKVNNDLNFRFRGKLPTDLGYLSVLAAACHLAGIDSRPGMRRDTAFDDDIAELHGLYLAHAEVTDAALNASHHTSALFARMKMRAGAAGLGTASWGSVVIAMQERYPGLQARRFFRHLPNGFCVDRQGRLVELRDAADQRRFAIELVRELYEDGLPVTPGALKRVPEVWRLLRRLEKGSLVLLVSEATGLPPEQVTHVTSGARIHSVETHTTCQDEARASVKHPALRSNTEAAIDDCLATFYGKDYCDKHQHDVKLETLTETLDYVGSPYTGNRSPDVDIVFPLEKIAVEISHRSDITRPGYKEKLDWKIAQLQEAGWQALAIHAATEADQKETARQVSVLLDMLRRSTPLGEIQGFLTRYKGGKLTRFSFDEAKREVRRLGFSTSTEYFSSYRQSSGLPGNPNTAYEGEWTGWPEFLGNAVPYEDFDEAHASARGRFTTSTDYRRRCEAVDPRLPAAPDEMYADRGWQGWLHFLGNTDAIHEQPPDFHLLVALREVASQLRLSVSRVSGLRNEAPGLQPVFERPVTKRGEDRCFYRQSDIDAFMARPDARRDHKLTFDELAAELQRHGIRDTSAYERHHRESLRRGEEHLPVSPESFFKGEFDERGGWQALFGLPEELLPDDPMTPEEVAEYAGRSKSAVTQWRQRTPGLHPRVERAYAPRGTSRLVYSRRDVDAFLAGLRRHGTE